MSNPDRPTAATPSAAAMRAAEQVSKIAEDACFHAGLVIAFNWRPWATLIDAAMAEPAVVLAQEGVWGWCLLDEIPHPKGVHPCADFRPAYDPEFGDERQCKCGHVYRRHFDSYDRNRPAGCKYCECPQWAQLEDAAPSRHSDEESHD